MLRNWIGILRPVNLLLLAATLYAMDACVLQPNFSTYGIAFSMNEWHFFLLVLSIVMICAGGYILNDHNDVAMDQINKPEKVFIGEGKIAPLQAMRVYLVLSVAGLALGIYLSLYVGFWKLIAVYLLCIALLYFYSTTFKRVPLAGNVMVALLTGISVMMVYVFEPHLYQLARPADYYIAGLCTRFIIALAVFAYALTMVREIVKDMEDMEGDAQSNARTMPIAWGVAVSKGMAIFHILFTLAALVYLYYNVLDPGRMLYDLYLGIMVAVMLMASVWLVVARNKQHYARLSAFMKLCMLLGLLVLPIYYYYFTL